MGLFNHLFGNKSKAKERTARKLVMDDVKRWQLWEKHLGNYIQREQLSKHFSLKNINSALADFSATKKVLKQIENLILPELITLDAEKKTEEEIRVDLQQLKDVPQIEVLVQTLVHDRNKHLTLPLIFDEIYNLLLVELHLLKLLQKNPPNARNLLLQLFELIFHREAMLYKPFKEDSYFQENKAIHAEISQLAKAVLLEERLQEKVETAEEQFAREMAARMSPHESKRTYRKLGEDIYYVLAEMAGAPVRRGEDITKAIHKMEENMQNDALMLSVVRRLRPKYNEVKIKAVILAFRQAYALGHFEDLENEFST